MRQDTSHKGSSIEAPDPVDEIIEQWRRERPDLDPSGKAITGRIIRLEPLLQQAFGEAFAPLGINESDFGVLVVLRRSGAPFELTPSELARHRMITSGGMTAALDRLERKGLLVRSPNPNDRRGSLVRLTDEGRAVVDRAMELHSASELRLVAALTAREREQLATLLRKLLRSVEG